MGPRTVGRAARAPVMLFSWNHAVKTCAVSQGYKNDFFRCRKGMISVHKTDLDLRAMWSRKTCNRHATGGPCKSGHMLQILWSVDALNGHGRLCVRKSKSTACPKTRSRSGTRAGARLRLASTSVKIALIRCPVSAELWRSVHITVRLWCASLCDDFHNAARRVRWHGCLSGARHVQGTSSGRRGKNAEGACATVLYQSSRRSRTLQERMIVRAGRLQRNGKHSAPRSIVDMSKVLLIRGTTRCPS